MSQTKLNSTKETCFDCKGSGKKAIPGSSKLEECWLCDGTGEVSVSRG